jgi:hypothetical protein
MAAHKSPSPRPTGPRLGGRDGSPTGFCPDPTSEQNVQKGAFRDRAGALSVLTVLLKFFTCCANLRTLFPCSP